MDNIFLDYCSNNNSILEKNIFEIEINLFSYINISSPF